jgi:hypothetical protein
MTGRGATLQGVGAVGQVGTMYAVYWSLIDDNESITWQNIDNSESTTWTLIEG